MANKDQGVAQHDQAIIDGYAAGKAVAQIASEIGKSKTAVWQRAGRLKIRHTSARLNWSRQELAVLAAHPHDKVAIGKKLAHRRYDHCQRKAYQMGLWPTRTRKTTALWDAKHDALLRQMWDQGLTIKQIARKLDMQPEQIRYRRSKLNLPNRKVAPEKTERIHVQVRIPVDVYDGLCIQCAKDRLSLVATVRSILINHVRGGWNNADNQ